MGIDLKAAIARRDAAIINLRELFSSARMFGPLHTKMQDDIKAISEKHLIKCPRWVWSEYAGYTRALADQLYVDALIHGGFYKGEFYTTHSYRADYYAKHGIEPSAWADQGKVQNRGHYWGTTKQPMPYFIGSQ